jgi:hypothetical protein
MVRTIENAIYEDNHAIYTEFRKEFNEKIEHLEKERLKMSKRRGKNKER